MEIKQSHLFAWDSRSASIHQRLDRYNNVHWSEIMVLTIRRLLKYLRSSQPDLDELVRGTHLLKRAVPAMLSPDRLSRGQNTPVQWLIFEVSTRESSGAHVDPGAMREARKAYIRAVINRWMKIKGVKK
jgi:hypothetical protein